MGEINGDVLAEFAEVLWWREELARLQAELAPLFRRKEPRRQAGL